MAEATIKRHLSPTIEQDRHDIELDVDVEAKPLVMPDFVNVKPKNPAVALRWINFVWQNGLRYQQCRYAGWENAKIEDCQVNSIPLAFLKEGGIRNGDLILMKHQDTLYRGALKYNRERALALVGRQAIRAKQESELRQETAGANPELKSKLRAFQPTEDELKRIVDAAPDADKQPAQAPGNPGAPPVASKAQVNATILKTGGPTPIPK
jgi:hypothetical protein